MSDNVRFPCAKWKRRGKGSLADKRHKIEMTNGLPAYKRYARRLIRRFNLDSAAGVCSALRRGNLRRGSKGKLKNIRARKWSIRGR